MICSCANDDTEVARIRFSGSHARPFADFRDAHAAIRQPAHRDLVEPRSGVQAGTKSVAAPLVRPDALDVEVVTDLEPVNAVGDLAVLARLLDSRTEVSVSQRDTALVAARGIDNLAGRDGTVGINPVAPPPTVSSGWVGDLLAVAMQLCR